MKKLLQLLKKMLAVFFVVTVIIVPAGGCTPAKKPINPDNKLLPKTMPRLSADQARQPAPKGIPVTPEELDRAASGLASLASGVPGVDRAYVALANTAAFVGIEMENRAGALPGTAKKEIADRIMGADRRLARVYVTTDKATVSRIKGVAKGIASGRQVSDFAMDIAEIERRIVQEGQR
ncbi:YhcN/YlaJ family sporulation lipoprotein [Phosphitispora fastidiosa]|uniref:YhcN/YlaJ family sporulation lipoprotein n=1 Tax=Phosphitispora fastidiosa TaxID=2837202 RepID=UPI001E3BFFFA|nr:YhcN/YlaJ family sporulation lipoprotein [Phosphitispora fastidiosa]MBU7005711.1 YhcN/YlaJ family sporulation lipoprotein [Phosphitispora fastidiosa]